MGRILTGLILLVGTYWIVEGIQRGHMYGRLQATDLKRLTITKVYNAVNRRIFPDYRVAGYVEGATNKVEVGIFQEQFRRLRPGEILDVYPLHSSVGTNWVAAAKISESKPIVNILDFRFSWHLPAGTILTLAAIVKWHSERRRRTAAATRQISEHKC